MNLVGTLTTSRKKWLIASSVMFGTILVVMDMNMNMVSVALPQMMGTFGKTQSAITWVATSYIIAELVLVTMAGWLSTVLGRKRLYLLSFLLFILASALAGTAHTFAQMLAYRTLQGIGGGSLVPLTGAILRETFPRREWAMAMAIYGMAVVIASGVAPLLGGWLTDEYGVLGLLHQRSYRPDWNAPGPFPRGGSPLSKKRSGADRLGGHHSSLGGSHRNADRPGWGDRRRIGSNPRQ